MISKRIFMGMLISIVVFWEIGFSHAVDSTNLVFLTWKPNQPKVWERLIEQFQLENQDIRIKLQVGPHSSTEYHAILTQRLKNRDPSVDIYFMDVIWPPEFANAGWAIDLTSRFPIRVQNEFLHGPVSANTYKGGIYGVPCYLGAGLFYYRKDLLRKYGFAPPQTWDEMLSQGQAIFEGEGDSGLHIYSAQFKQYEGLVCDMMEFIWSHGGDVIDYETGQAVLAESPAIEAVAFVRNRIIGKAAPTGAINYKEPESLDLFVQGKAIFHRNWPYAWAVANDPEKSKIAGKVGVGPLPSFSDRSSVSTLGGWQFGINRYSNNPDKAWRFISFMTSHRVQRVLALKAGLAPTRISVYSDAEVQEKMPHLKAFLPAFKRARPRPLSPVYPMISQELQRFFSRAIVDRESELKEMAKATSARIEKLFQLGEMVQK